MQSQSSLHVEVLPSNSPPSQQFTLPLKSLNLGGKHLSSSKISKASVSKIKVHNLLASQRFQYILLESEVRRLNKRIELEQEIIKNKKMFHEIEDQIKAEEQKVKEKKRSIIKTRIQNMEANKRKREEEQSQGNQKVHQIKAKEKMKEILMKKILEKNKSQYNECYQNALAQRKVAFGRPINFQAIYSHEKKYLRTKARNKTTFEGYEDDRDINQESVSVEKLRIKNNKSGGSGSRSIELSDRDRGYSFRGEHQEQQKYKKSVIEEQLEIRRKQRRRIQEIKQLREKSKQYGNRVQAEYKRSHIKTQAIEMLRQKEKQQAQEKERQIRQINNILKNMKKPNIPEHFGQDIQERKMHQIEKLAHSNKSVEEKMKRLNLMSETEIKQIDRKNRVEDLERLNQINMLRVKLLLDLE